MAVVTLYSAQLTSLNLSPPVHPTVQLLGGRERVCQDVVTIGTTDTAPSIYLYTRLPSKAIITSIRKFHAAQAGTTAVDFGIFNSATGVAIVQAVYSTANSFAVADTTGTEMAWGAKSPAKVGQALWQDAGLATDPGGVFDLGFTVTTIGVAGGAVGMHIRYILD